MIDIAKKAKKAKTIVASLSPSIKNDLLLDIAKNISLNKQEIYKANQKDMANAISQNVSATLQNRLLLDDKAIESMIKAIQDIVKLPEPVGKILTGWKTQKDLNIQKVSTPIGVIAVIYESRPNVTSDVAALCIKSGNVVILKGGKEANNSNKAIIDIIHKTIHQHNLPIDMVVFLDDCDRSGTKELLKYDNYIDMVVPRGGAGLIKFVSTNSSIPVVKHDRGLCHTYIDKSADIQVALDISINAKCRRVEICGAMESLLVDKDIAKQFLPLIKQELEKRDIVLKGCEETLKIINIQKATTEDFDTEYLDRKLSIKIVCGVQQAIEHINTHGSQHSDAIVATNIDSSTQFLDEVDSACVYLNSSTQFTDGGEFGFGAEVGISTNKLHCRGPMGLNDLTTYKYKITSNGATRD